MAKRAMTAHTLETPKGWPHMAAVDFQAGFDATQLSSVSGNVAFAGRCVHLGDDGEFEFGVSGTQMPMWLFQNSDDPDVVLDGGNPATTIGAYVAAAGPTSKINAMVAKGAYELATTEFDSAQTYLPNELLYAATGTTLATCGVLTNQNLGGKKWPAIAAVGCVSRGRNANSAKNAHGVAELYFWPGHYPGMDGRGEPTW